MEDQARAPGPRALCPRALCQEEAACTRPSGRRSLLLGSSSGPGVKVTEMSLSLVTGGLPNQPARFSSCCTAESQPPGAAALTIPGVCAGVTLTVLRLSEDLARLWETERSADRPPGSLAYVGEQHVCAATGRALPPGPQPGVGEQMSRPLHFPGRPSPSPTEGHRPDAQTETDSPALTMRLREGS